MAKQKESQKKVNYAAGKINVKIIKSRGKVYRQRWVYLPAQLIDAGDFPFHDNEPILVVVDAPKKRVILQKLTPQPL